MGKGYCKKFYSIIEGTEKSDGEDFIDRDIEKEFDISAQMFETLLYATQANIKEYNMGFYKGKHTEATIKKISRKAIPPKKRWKIMQRDGFRCVKCGKGINDTDCLQVDHIIPVTKEGTNEEDNLQTLCWECNIGKFNEISPRSNSPSASAEAEDLICVKEEFQK